MTVEEFKRLLSEFSSNMKVAEVRKALSNYDNQDDDIKNAIRNYVFNK